MFQQHCRSQQSGVRGNSFGAVSIVKRRLFSRSPIFFDSLLILSSDASKRSFVILVSCLLCVCVCVLREKEEKIIVSLTRHLHEQKMKNVSRTSFLFREQGHAVRDHFSDMPYLQIRQTNGQHTTTKAFPSVLHARFVSKRIQSSPHFRLFRNLCDFEEYIQSLR